MSLAIGFGVGQSHRAALGDTTQAEAFLKALGKHPANACLRAFPHKGSANYAAIGPRKGGWDLEQAAAWNQQGRSAFLVIGNGGHKAAEITSCPAIFCEWDNRPLQWQLNAWRELGLPEPSIQVASGGKSIHTYWVFLKPISPEQWRNLQARLIAHCQSDPSLKDPSRVMRLPGFAYIGPDDKPSGWAELIHLSDNRYLPAELEACLPELEPTPAPATPGPGPAPAPGPGSQRLQLVAGGLAGELPPRGFDQIREALAYIPPRSPGSYETHRRALAGLIAAVEQAGGTEDQAIALMEGHCPSASSGWNVAQVARSSTTREAATFWAIASEHGYNLSRDDLRASHRPRPQPQRSSDQGPPQQQAKDAALQSYSQLIGTTLQAIKDGQEDHEMAARAELKHRFSVSDEQISTALFKRHSAERVQINAAIHDSVDMEKVEQLEYLLDGWIPRGDVVLTYGAAGSGKTTLALAKMHAHVTGKNLLDRDTPCTPGRGLFIATDSGTGPLKKAMQDLRLDPDNSTLMKPGHPDQRIWVWGHEPGQGHSSWVCDIHGVIRLEQFIRKHGITYVVIDSAKSVSSAAGWSYCSNESVKALLQYLRQGVAQPTGCCLEFLSHDGTAQGSHSGAKAWAEDPSMVCALEPAIDPETKQFSGILAKFRKDRAAVIDPRRTIRFGLNDGQLELHPEVEVVSSCTDVVLTILWEAYQRGVTSVHGRELKAEALARYNRSHKTVENTLGKITGTGSGPNPSKVIRPRHGAYALAPKELAKRVAAAEGDSYRGLSFMGGVSTKPLAAQSICQPPIETPIGGIGGFETPHQIPMGGLMGGTQNPVRDRDLTETPPDIGTTPPKSEPEEEPYESPERIADTRAERIPQAVREQRDADRIWERQHRQRTAAEPQAGAPITRSTTATTATTAPAPTLRELIQVAQAEGLGGLELKTRVQSLAMGYGLEQPFGAAIDAELAVMG